MQTKSKFKLRKLILRLAVKYSHHCVHTNVSTSLRLIKPVFQWTVKFRQPLSLGGLFELSKTQHSVVGLFCQGIAAVLTVYIILIN